MSQNLPINGFKSKNNKFNFYDDFIQSYDENNDKGYIFEGDINYPRKLQKTHSDLPFLPESMKIDKCEKLVCNLYDKKNYVMHIRALKQALDHGLILKKVQKVNEFNLLDSILDSWLKPYIDINTKLRAKVKNNFQKTFFKDMNNLVYGKTMENVKKHRYIKLVTTDRIRSCLVAKPNYHTTKWFSENLPATEMNKTEVTTNKLVSLGLSILDINKIATYEY